MEDVRFPSPRVVSPCASLTELMKLVAGSLRREILLALTQGPMPVTQLADSLDLDVGPVSRDLARLHKRGLVTVTRDGQRHIYGLTEKVSFEIEPEHTIMHVACSNGEAIALDLNPLRLDSISE